MDMKRPGISVKPIITLDQRREGFQEINTVYFEDVKVPKENLVGAQGKGWTCAKYLLEFERGNAHSPALKGAMTDVKDAQTDTNGIGNSYWQDEGFQRRFHDVEVQVLAMEYTELRILGAFSAHSRRIGGRAERRSGKLDAQNPRNRAAAGGY